jgi:hypothetical protein
LSSLDLSELDGGSINAIDVLDDIVYLSTNNNVGGFASLACLDVGYPLNPFIRSVTKGAGGGNSSHGIKAYKPLNVRTMVFFAKFLGDNNAALFVVKDKDAPLCIGSTAPSSIDSGSGVVSVAPMRDRLYVASGNNKKILVYNGMSTAKAFFTHDMVSGGPFLEGEMIVKTSGTGDLGATATIVEVGSGELSLANLSQINGNSMM